MCCESFEKIVGAVSEILEKARKVENLPKITLVVTVGKKSNSRDRDNENQLNFHGDER